MHLKPVFLTLAFAIGCGSSIGGNAAEATRDQDVGQFMIRASLGDGELRRSIYPRFRTELATQGDDGITRKLRIPFELYTEVRTYQGDAGDDAGASYERAYTRMVESGDCRPVAAGFREASFDCGAAKGRRTVAVRQDARGTYFTWESKVTDQVPDPVGFEAALRALDDLTEQLLTRPTGNAAGQ